MPDARLPTVIASSVVRSSQQGESHGGVYIVDLERGDVEQVVDWNDPDIDWEGRGADRGLRGIAFHEDRILCAASDEVFVYDRGFNIVASFRNAYLKHCHEIFARDGLLYLSSTGYDSVLVLDLATERFVHGVCYRRVRSTGGALRQAGRWLGVSPPTHEFFAYDPNEERAVTPADTNHINNVFARDDGVYFSGTKMDALMRVRPGNTLERIARVPAGTHNVTLDGAELVFNDTKADVVRSVSRGSGETKAYAIPKYDESLLERNDLPQDHARQGFGRGLIVTDDLIISGSSPSTITAYDRATAERIRSVNLTMDVRNAIHGLELHPFAR